MPLPLGCGLCSPIANCWPVFYHPRYVTFMEPKALLIREPTGSEWEWIAEAAEEIGGPVVVSGGCLYDLREHPTLIALWGQDPVGLIIFRELGDTVELLAIKAARKNQGIGSALLSEVEDMARQRSIRCIRLSTTNDNLDALRFYQKRGFRVSAYLVGAFDDVLRLKGEAVVTELVGNFGIVIRDVIELSKPIAPKPSA